MIFRKAATTFRIMRYGAQCLGGVAQLVRAHLTCPMPSPPFLLHRVSTLMLLSRLSRAKKGPPRTDGA